ncbi:MAG TPA: hypothetical protein VF297_22920 [Pyrinomonadaceae bacterium]
MKSGTPAGAARSASAGRGRRLALAALLLGLLGSFTMKAQEMGEQSANPGGAEAQCAANLKQIFRLIKAYQHQSAGVLEFPQDLVVNIGPMSHEETLLTCPADTQTGAATGGAARVISYRFVNDPERPALARTAPGRIALVAEERPNHDGKRLVLFYDGSVRALDNEQFERLKRHHFLEPRRVVKNR